MFVLHCAYLWLCARFGRLSDFVCMNACLDRACVSLRVRVCSVHSTIGLWGGEGPDRLVDREWISRLLIVTRSSSSW